jgi:hypothetical protein
VLWPCCFYAGGDCCATTCKIKSENRVKGTCAARTLKKCKDPKSRDYSYAYVNPPEVTLETPAGDYATSAIFLGLVARTTLSTGITPCIAARQQVDPLSNVTVDNDGCPGGNFDVVRTWKVSK